MGWGPERLVKSTTPGSFCRNRDFLFSYLRMAAGGPLSAAQCVPKGMPAVHPPLRVAICGVRLALRATLPMAPGWRVFSKGKAPPDRRDACPMDPPPTHQLSPSTASHAVIVMSNMPFAGVFEASLHVPGHAFDIFTGLMQSARDCARLKDAAWQQVSLSSQTLAHSGCTGSA